VELCHKESCNFVVVAAGEILALKSSAQVRAASIIMAARYCWQLTELRLDLKACLWEKTRGSPSGIDLA
jgi:hypothetical protein